MTANLMMLDITTGGIRCGQTPQTQARPLVPENPILEANQLFTQRGSCDARWHSGSFVAAIKRFAPFQDLGARRPPQSGHRLASRRSPNTDNPCLDDAGSAAHVGNSADGAFSAIDDVLSRCLPPVPELGCREHRNDDPDDYVGPHR